MYDCDILYKFYYEIHNNMRNIIMFENIIKNLESRWKIVFPIKVLQKALWTFYIFLYISSVFCAILLSDSTINA